MAKAINIPKYSGGNLTAQSTYRAPTPGTGATKIVSGLTKIATELDTQMASEAAFAKGVEQQQKALEQGENYVGPTNAFSVTAQAYQKGANTAFITSKSLELEDELTKLGEKYSLDPDKFTQASEEYKSNWMKTLPSNLQPQLSLGFDKARNNLLLQVSANQRQDQFEQNLDVVKKGADDSVRKLALSLQNQGYTDSLMEYFGDIEAKYEAIKTQFNLSTADMRKIKAGHRSDIVNAFVLADFNKVKNDPEATAQLKKQIVEGTYTMDGNPLGGEDEGYDFSEVIPGGDRMSLTEIEVYSNTIDTLIEKQRKGLVEVREQLKFTTEQSADRISKAEVGFGFEDGQLKVNIPPFPFEEYVSAGYTDQEIRAAQIDYQQKISIGTARATAITTPIAQIDFLKSKINEKIKTLDSSNYAEAKQIETLELQLEAIDEEKKAKIEAFKPENNVTDYFINRLGYNIDLSTSEGTNQMQKIVSENTGVPPGGLRVSRIQADVELDAIQQSIQQDYSAFQNTAINMRSRQGKAASSYINEALRGQKDTNGYAILTAVEMATSSENTRDSKILFDAIKNADQYKSAATSRADISQTDVNDAIKAVIDQNLLDGIDQTTGFGKSTIDVVKKIMYQSLGTGATVDEAKRKAESFIEANYVKINHDVGDGITWMSKNMAGGTYMDARNNSFSRQTEITKLINDVKQNPHRYGITLADGQTYDELDDMIDNMKVVQENGQLIFKSDDRVVTTAINQKLPSSERDNFYATFFITPDKDMVISEDKEFTWNYEHKNANWYKQWQNTNDGKTTRMVNTRLGPKEFEFDDTLDDWGQKFAEETQKQLFDKIVLGDAVPGYDMQQVYEDSMSRNLFPQNTMEKQIADGISLALTNQNNIDDAMLLWLGAKSSYLSRLKNKETRDYVKKYWKQNFDSIQNLTTNNDMPVQMSVLQALTTIVREAPQFTPAISGEGGFEGGA